MKDTVLTTSVLTPLGILTPSLLATSILRILDFGFTTTILPSSQPSMMARLSLQRSTPSDRYPSGLATRTRLTLVLFHHLHKFMSTKMETSGLLSTCSMSRVSMALRWHLSYRQSCLRTHRWLRDSL